MSHEPRSLAEIQRIGLEALDRALGPVGMVRFLQYSETGAGDYSAERSEWLDQLSVSEVADAIEERRQAGEAE